MANPDPENGHIDIPHELVEVLMKINIPANHYRVLWLIWRKTYGWHKDSEYISLSYFEKCTDLDRRNIGRSIKALEKKNIIKVKRDKEINTYSFNPDYETWKIKGSVRGDTSVNGDTTPVSEVTPEPVSLETLNKEKKETLKKKGDSAKDIFDYYCKKIKKLKVWDKKRKIMIGARLKKWTPEELCQAIDGVANSDWHMENGQTSFEMIFRNDRQVEKYLGLNNKVNNNEEIPWTHQS
jgi:phage replication O-like protein O